MVGMFRKEKEKKVKTQEELCFAWLRRETKARGADWARHMIRYLDTNPQVSLPYKVDRDDARRMAEDVLESYLLDLKIARGMRR